MSEMTQECSVLLPSRGKFYGDKLPSGQVQMRVITIKEEKILAGAKNKVAAADRVLERCLIGCPVPLKEMLVSDKFFLLLHLRSISYGTKYDYRVVCAACGRKFTHSTELLSGLQIMMAADDDREPFEVELPISKKKLALRFLRWSDEEEIYAMAEQNARVQASRGGDAGDEEDPTYEPRIAKHIVSIDGVELNMLEKLTFVGTLTGADSWAIRKTIAGKDTGVSLAISAKCPACTFQNEMTLPINNEFFPAGVS